VTESAARVLICDDEPQILRALRIVLRDAGFEVVPASTAEEALDAASLRPPDAAIVDLLLPDGSGIDVCRSLRGWTAAPIIVLSAVGEEDAKVAALEAGADDYVQKPFGPRELVARLHAALRRAGQGAASRSSTSTAREADLAARVVRRDGADVHLTPIEFELLRTLIRTAVGSWTHRALLTEVWGPQYGDATRCCAPTSPPAAQDRAAGEPRTSARRGVATASPAETVVLHDLDGRSAHPPAS
jgi:two-component system KDP operon response regulator KdpE